MVQANMVDTHHKRKLKQFSDEDSTENSAQVYPSKLSADALGLLRYIEQEEYTSVMELQHFSGLTREEIESSLAELEEENLIITMSGNSVDLVVLEGSFFS